MSAGSFDAFDSPNLPPLVTMKVNIEGKKLLKNASKLPNFAYIGSKCMLNPDTSFVWLKDKFVAMLDQL